MATEVTVCMTPARACVYCSSRADALAWLQAKQDKVCLDLSGAALCFNVRQVKLANSSACCTE
jgi:hypothetical protein